MHPTNRTARLAGVIYLAGVITAPFSLVYVPRTLIVRGDAAATARNILAHETLFRAGIVGELVGAVMSVFLMLVLYKLLNRVNKMQAIVMVIFGVLMSAPLAFFGVINQLAALTLLHGADFLSVFDHRQLEAGAMFFLGLHRQAIVVQQIFWGLWLFPFGLLVFRSGFFPRILGVLLIINGFPYVIASVTTLLIPDHAYSSLSRSAVILETGELWMMLWLLIKGARVEPLPEEKTA